MPTTYTDSGRLNNTAQPRLAKMPTNMPYNISTIREVFAFGVDEHVSNMLVDHTFDNTHQQFARACFGRCSHFRGLCISLVHTQPPPSVRHTSQMGLSNQIYFGCTKLVWVACHMLASNCIRAPKIHALFLFRSKIDVRFKDNGWTTTAPNARSNSIAPIAEYAPSGSARSLRARKSFRNECEKFAV